MQIELDLESLDSETLAGVVSEGAGILAKRSSPFPTVQKEEPVKKGKKKTKRRGQTKDFSELDKFLKGNFGRMSIKELTAMAKEKGITTDHKQIYYRKKVLGLTKKWKNNPAANKHGDPLGSIPPEDVPDDNE